MNQEGIWFYVTVAFTDYTGAASSTLGESLQKILSRLNKGNPDIRKEFNLGEGGDFKSFLATR